MLALLALVLGILIGVLGSAFGSGYLNWPVRLTRQAPRHAAEPKTGPILLDGRPAPNFYRGPARVAGHRR